MLQVGRAVWAAGGRLSSSCSVVPSSMNEVVKLNGKLGRSSKQQCRECDLAAAFYKEGKRSGLRKLMKIVTKQRDTSEATSRCAAFAAALALKLGKVPEAHEMLSHVTMSPAIIRRSLLVNVLVSEGRLDDALDEVEGCLQEEDVIFNSENSCISDEALDTLCNSIKERSDTQKQMQRFRALQRVITAYNRRSTRSVEELLHTPLHTGLADEEPTRSTSKLDLSDKVIAQVPQFLAEEK